MPLPGGGGARLSINKRALRARHHIAKIKMNHAKKYFLIEPDRYPRESVAGESTSRSPSELDSEIQNILNGLEPPDIKVKLYVQALKKYNDLNKRDSGIVDDGFTANRSANINSVGSGNSGINNHGDSGIQNRLTPDIENEVLDSVPLEWRYKAKRILRAIKQNPSVEIDAKGRLIYRQTIVPFSNISDLIYDVLKTSGNKETGGPPGWREFADVIAESDIKADGDLIANKKYTYKRKSKRKHKAKSRDIDWIEY